MNLRHLQSMFAIAAACAACGALSETGVYRGTYFYNFENSVLTPQGTTERWCVDGDMSKAILVSKNGASEPWGTADVKIRGELGPVGRYGSLGACSRVLTVHEVIAVSNKKSLQ
ncbi:MAG: hypothetical protein WKG03_06465 [Telluria sp.]